MVNIVAMKVIGTLDLAALSREKKKALTSKVSVLSNLMVLAVLGLRGVW